MIFAEMTVPADPWAATVLHLGMAIIVAVTIVAVLYVIVRRD